MKEKQEKVTERPTVVAGIIHKTRAYKFTMFLCHTSFEHHIIPYQKETMLILVLVYGVEVEGEKCLTLYGIPTIKPRVLVTKYVFPIEMRTKAVT